MTDAEWLACADPNAMLQWVWPEPPLHAMPGQQQERAWHYRRPAALRKLHLFLLHACPRRGRTRVYKSDLAYADRAPMGDKIDLLFSHWLRMEEGGGRRGFPDPGRAADLLRDLLGVPGDDLPVRAEVLWNPVVMNVAAVVYDDVDRSGAYDPPGVLALADAVEEAGGGEAGGFQARESDVLAHLRSPGPHVRGCWAVDLLIGRI